MKVVLLHDWLTGFRGGERVLEVFCEMFPEAPLYTLIHQKGTTSPIIENREIKTSFLNKIPGIYKNYRKFLPIFPIAASMMKITEEADLVLSSSHCVIKAIKKPAGSKHISFVHSPMRYIYDQFDNYFSDVGIVQKIGAHACRPYLKLYDYHTNTNVDHFIANANFVKDRIEKYYDREAEVIHPFVDLKDFSSAVMKPSDKEDFYLMVTAFAPNKRVDLAVEAFNKLGLNLKIVGGGQQEEYLKQIANRNIEFLGNVSREEVVSLMARAQAFIFPGVEDFGITPLESMAAGTPIIAYKAGGVLETLNDKVAMFFEEASSSALVDAVSKFDLANFRQEDLHDRSQEFSKEHFRSKIEGFIQKNMN